MEGTNYIPPKSLNPFSIVTSEPSWQSFWGTAAHVCGTHYVAIIGTYVCKVQKNIYIFVYMYVRI